MTNSNKMATMPISSLFFKMSVPAVFSMVIQALYNIVDTIYVAQISEDALFTMGLVFPLQMIALSIALGGSVGVSTLISRKLGEKNKTQADKIAATGIIITLFHMIIVFIIGIYFSRSFLRLFTDNPIIIEGGYDYLSVVLGASFGLFGSVFFEKIQQSQGNTVVPMIAMLIGAITNIILDPVFIFGYFGVPAMGIKGAAIATVIGQIFGFLYILQFSLFKKHEIDISFKGFKLEISNIKEIYKIGLPVTVMNMIGSIATTILNSILVPISTLGVTALGIYFKLQSFIFMPVFGFNQGALPILSYNFGAKNEKRFKDTIKVYILSSLVIMSLGTLAMWGFTNQLLFLFKASDELISVGQYTLRFISISFPFAALTIASITILQSLGKAFSSLMISILRQLVFLVPFSLLLSKWLGANGVWLSFPIAEVLVLIIYLPKVVKMINQGFKDSNPIKQDIDIVF